MLKNEPFRLTEFDRRRQISFLDMKIKCVSPEDLQLSKLIWIQEVQSSVQVEDIKALKTIRDLDFHYITRWMAELKLNTFDLFK
jgi:aspartate carbamoyltransferase catalytic subunit